MTQIGRLMNRDHQLRQQCYQMNEMISMRKILKMIKIERVPNVSYRNVTNNKSKKKTQQKGITNR